MEVVAFESDREFGTLIREGLLEVRGHAHFEVIAPARTRLTISSEMPSDPRWDPSLITKAMQRSAQTIKELIEGKT